MLYIKRRKKEVHVYFCKGIGFAISTNCSCHMLVLAYNTNSNSESNINIYMQVDASDIYGVLKIWEGRVLPKGLMCNLP